jgi:GNAT superfamily N-acetyltransferase
MQAAQQLNIQPVTAERFEDLAALFRTGLARACWDMEPRQTAAEDAACRRRWRADGVSRKDGRRRAFLELLAQAHMPGLLAYRQGQAVGWVSIGPRSDYPRIEQSRALPPLDELAVWAIPCVYVHPAERGQGVAVALLRAAVEYAAGCGAPAVEGYPRDPAAPISAEEAFYGTVAMFTRAGFAVVRPPLPVSPRPGRLASRCGLHARQHVDEAGRFKAGRGSAAPERLGLGVLGPSASWRVGCWSRSRGQ